MILYKLFVQGSSSKTETITPLHARRLVLPETQSVKCLRKNCRGEIFCAKAIRP